MRGIKNRDKLKKEDLITNLLKSESSNAEYNYMKHLNNTNDNNNTNDHDDTYDSWIRHKISDFRIILSRLLSTITNKDEKKIKKELYKIENKQNLSDTEKEKIYDHLVELARTLDNNIKIKISWPWWFRLLWNKRQKLYLMLMLVMLIITNQY